MKYYFKVDLESASGTILTAYRMPDFYDPPLDYVEVSQTDAETYKNVTEAQTASYAGGVLTVE